MRSRFHSRTSAKMAIHGGYLCMNVKKYEGNTSAPKGNKSGINLRLKPPPNWAKCWILSPWRALNPRLKPLLQWSIWGRCLSQNGNRYEVETYAPKGRYKANTSNMKGKCMRLKPLPQRAIRVKYLRRNGRWMRPMPPPQRAINKRLKPPPYGQ